MSNFLIKQMGLEEIQYYEYVIINFFLLVTIVILVQWINIFSASISINSILRKEVKLKKYMKRVFDNLMRRNDN